MMRKFIALILLAGLAACGSTPMPPPGPPGPPPAVVPRPGVLVASFDFTGPNLGVVNGCDGDVMDLDCHLAAGAIFGTFTRPGTQGIACIDPGPNACWSANGVLNATPQSPGYPLISNQTFSGSVVSVEATVSLICDQPETGDGSYAGIAVIFAEKNYNADYLRCAGAPPGMVQPHVFNSIGEYPVSAHVWPQGQLHALRVDWHGSTVDHLIDGILEYTETDVSGPAWGPLHAALWLGNSSHIMVTRMDVYRAP